MCTIVCDIYIILCNQVIDADLSGLCVGVSPRGWAAALPYGTATGMWGLWESYIKYGMRGRTHSPLRMHSNPRAVQRAFDNQQREAVRLFRPRWSARSAHPARRARGDRVDHDANVKFRFSVFPRVT